MIPVEEVTEQFQDLNHVVLATIEVTSPRLRPITLMKFKDSFFFATNPTSNKSKHIESNPIVELLLQWKEESNNGYIRVSGKAIKVNDESIVQGLWDYYDYMRKLWSGPVDPSLVIYRIQVQYYDYMKPGEWESIKIETKTS